MFSVLLQRAHYPNGGGAPGEAAWTADLVSRVTARLPADQFEVTVVDDFFNKPYPPEVVGRKYDLVRFYHYDASVYGPGNNTGCFSDKSADARVEQAESQRFVDLWNSVYPDALRIPLTENRRNANTFWYYGYTPFVGTRVPCVLTEHGCGSTSDVFNPATNRYYPVGQDSLTLHQQIDLVAGVEARIIAKFFGVTLEEDEMAALTQDQRDLLKVASDRQVYTGQQLSDLCDWSGEIWAENEALRTQVGSLQVEAQDLSNRIANPPTSIVSVVVKKSDGTSEEVH